MKKLWNKNRVLFVLITILVVCFIAIIAVTLTFFYTKNVGTYGSRLENIEKHPIKEKVKNKFEDTLMENEHVKKVSISDKGRIIYVHVDFDDKISLEDAKALIANNYELFGENLLSYYDFEFILKSTNFTTIGAKNSIVDHISWNNNRIVKDEEENSNEK